jgi:hypothetical protein
MSIISQALVSQAEKLARSAKNGSVKIGDQTYTLTFNHREWVYVVTDEAGETVARFNTKTLSKAKQWTRDWFAN